MGGYLEPFRKWRMRRIRADLGSTAVFHDTTTFYPTTVISNAIRVRDNISIGAFTHVRGELLTMVHGGRISIGDHCYVGEQTRIWSGASITIGNRVLISHAVTIMDNLTHPRDPRARHQQYSGVIGAGGPLKIDLEDRPVAIEDDAWIGCHVVILRGVRIGNAAVIGAGTVVTADVPDGVTAVGNPMRLIVPKMPTADAGDNREGR